MSDDDRRAETAHGDDRPSKAVLDELLSMFEADDYTSGKDIDLTSPEVEALLSGGTSRPTPRADDEPDEPDQPNEPDDSDSDSDDGDDADADGEEHGDDRDEPETIVIVDEDVDAGTSDAVPGDSSPPGIVVIEADDLPEVVAVGDSPDPAVAAGREGAIRCSSTTTRSRSRWWAAPRRRGRAGSSRSCASAVIPCARHTGAGV
ncbi:MAG: hypothetical protein WKF58_12590 [Ilumatobacteraceae bacterium]